VECGFHELASLSCAALQQIYVQIQHLPCTSSAEFDIKLVLYVNREFTRADFATGTRERLFEDILRQTIEGAVLAKLHPRTLISISVQVSFPGNNHDDGLNSKEGCTHMLSPLYEH
jgi:hypothetical protein